ncbi:MAG: HIRAN domain-containing protein [Candidatus Brocadiia bacterium]
MSNALFVAWRSGGSAPGSWGPVGRLECNDGLYIFYYTRGARMLPGFQPFPEMNDLDQVYVSEELFPLFENRLLSKSRPEYDQFLYWGGFDPDNPPDPISILGVTEGIRQTDSIEVFPCPRPDSAGCYLNKFFLHGVRHVAQDAIRRISRLQESERLILEAEPSNTYDANAMAVWTLDRSHKIGYVPRYLAHEVRRLNEECRPEIVSLSVERVNRDAPLQQRVLCRMRACWLEGFQPCSTEDFAPIPSEAALLAAE